MSITLTDGMQTVTLPNDLHWSDRHWSAVSQSFTRGLTGKPIIMMAQRQYGRPITLQAPEDGGWMRLSEEAQILQWHNTPGQVLTLNYHGEVHSVQFRHYESPGYESEQVFYLVNPGPDHFVIPTLRLITVEP